MIFCTIVKSRSRFRQSKSDLIGKNFLANGKTLKNGESDYNFINFTSSLNDIVSFAFFFLACFCLYLVSVTVATLRVGGSNPDCAKICFRKIGQTWSYLAMRRSKISENELNFFICVFVGHSLL